LFAQAAITGAINTINASRRQSRKLTDNNAPQRDPAGILATPPMLSRTIGDRGCDRVNLPRIVMN
jgi:hypothetical protein